MELASDDGARTMPLVMAIEDSTSVVIKIVDEGVTGKCNVDEVVVVGNIWGEVEADSSSDDGSNSGVIGVGITKENSCSRHQLKKMRSALKDPPYRDCCWWSDTGTKG